MKKILSVLSLLLVILLFSACGNRIVIEKKDEETQTAAAQTEEISGFKHNDLEWAEKYFGTIFDYSEFDHYKIGRYDIRYCNDNNNPSIFNLNLTIDGKPLAAPFGYSEFNKIGFDFVETREETGDRYMGYRSIEIGQFENSNGSIISADLISKDVVATEKMSLSALSFEVNDASGNKAANSPEFEINGSINRSSSLQDIIASLGSPSSVEIEYRNPYYEVTVKYEGLTFDGSEPCFFSFGCKVGENSSVLTSVYYWQNVPDIFTEYNHGTN